MKKTVLFWIASVALLYSLQAQEVYKEFGKISPDEYKLTTHPLDPEAEAIVLYDIGESHFYNADRRFEIVYERATRIKILSEAGLKWAEIRIPFYQEGDIYEKIHDLEAISYLFDEGRIIKKPLNTENTYTETINKFWKVKKFALPDIKPGAIIEYRYKIYSQYIFHPREWYFQWRIPVLYSEYSFAMIPFYEYTYYLQGTRKEEVAITSEEEKMNKKQFGNITYTDLKHKFVRKDIPPFKSEDFISTPDDYLSKISFQLSTVRYPGGRTEQVMSSWEKLIDDLLKEERFGKYVSRVSKEAKKIIAPDDLKSKSESERFNHIIDYVKSNCTWNRNHGIYATKKPAQLQEEKTGNVADINLFALGLLNSAGIKSHPVLISTRPHGKIKTDYPFLHFFDYVIILSYVDGKTVISDATEPLLQNNRIPERSINDIGLTIDREKPVWVNTIPQNASLRSSHLKMEIRSPENLSVQLSKTLNEYDAIRFKTLYAEKKEQIKDFFERDNISVIDSTLRISDPDKRGRFQFYSYTCRYKPDYVNGKLYIAPFLYETLTKNPFKEKERSYPVDFTFKKSEQLNSTLLIPKGYKLEYIPENREIDNPLFSLQYKVLVIDNEISVSLNYLLKKAIYLPEEYEQLRAFFDEIVKKSTERIVVVMPGKE